jgi:hypothetical protein
MWLKSRILLLTFLVLGLVRSAVSEEIVSRFEVDSVWSGHRVGFCLLTHAPFQFAAYYDASRKMVVASRKLGDDDWAYITLPESVVWDSHNYITMTVDDEERLHLSGNLHVNPLVYFRTREPLDIDTFERVDSLVGSEEQRMTYPRFFRGPSGEFIYTYRDGSSGSGNQIYDVYDAKEDTWDRLLDQPLTDGQGKMNAYIDGPRLGPDGRYHCVWVWRDTPDCATNHHVSYMRSRDLRNWENIRGEALELPVTIGSPWTVVDPVPPGGGLINGNARLGFDGDNQPVVTYHKYDDAEKSQVFNARWMGEGWKSVPSTAWDSRWEFSGGGSIEFKVRVSPIRVSKSGEVTQEWSHWELGRQRWRLNPETLSPEKLIPPPAKSSSVSFGPVQSEFSGMEVRTAGDSGTSDNSPRRYVLRWETLGPNRDRPREKPWPEPSKLILYTIER